MRLAVFGLGYVGSVSAAGFADRGHDVLGVDTAPSKVDAINAGRSPVLEGGLGDLISAQVAAGRLRATSNGERAITTAEISVVCVGTPSMPTGGLSTTALNRVAATIGHALRGAERRHTVIVRSTMLPGTAEDLLIPSIESTSGLVVGRDFGFAVNPEFLREGSAVSDFRTPAKTVIGASDDASAAAAAALYNGETGTVVRLSVRGAEMAKYIDNAFHALKITFANEIGAICQAFDLDSHDVMRSFFADTKLNLSAAYLTPGFAFGGSCLPKDIRAILHAARHKDLALPLLENVLVSNEQCVSRVVNTVLALGRPRVGMLGLAFKPETDDLRESPFVELSERLIGKGCQLKIYDPGVALSQLVGANRDYIEQRIPHLSALLTDSLDAVLQHSEVCIVAAADKSALRALADTNSRVIIDLVRLPDASARREGTHYVGVAW